MIYLASPYSHSEPAVQEARFREACRAAAAMMRAGELVFSPIAYTHPIAAFGLPGDWAYWERFDREMLKICTEVRVLQLDGWMQSKGASAEVDLAHDLGLPVTFVDPIPEEEKAPPIPRMDADEA